MKSPAVSNVLAGLGLGRSVSVCECAAGWLSCDVLGVVSCCAEPAPPPEPGLETLRPAGERPPLRASSAASSRPSVWRGSAGTGGPPLLLFPVSCWSFALGLLPLLGVALG